MSPPTGEELISKYTPQIRGKVVLTTGISPGGLGAFFVQAIAKANPAWIILAGRDETKARETEVAIKDSNGSVPIRFLKMDLGSMQSVREAAQTVLGWEDVPAVDVLVNNAATMPAEYRVTADGFEQQLATNYLGHWLFTNLIMDKILASNAPRVVNVSSESHRISPFRFGDYNFDGGKLYTQMRGYGQSKTGNMLFSLSLAEKLGKRGLQSFSLHPGMIFTNGNVGLDYEAIAAEYKSVDEYYGYKEGEVVVNFLTPDQGIATYVYAAFDPNLASHNGSYLLECRVSDPLIDAVKPWAYSRFEAEKLWRLTEELLGQKFSLE